MRVTAEKTVTAPARAAPTIFLLFMQQIISRAIETIIMITKHTAEENAEVSIPSANPNFTKYCRNIPPTAVSIAEIKGKGSAGYRDMAIAVPFGDSQTKNKSGGRNIRTMNGSHNVFKAA